MSRIEDVAARAGVSMKTVSRVLNGEPHVRESLRERVRQAAADLQYRPNQAARRLAGRRSFVLAFLYSGPSRNYVASIQTGVLQKCRELGYHLVVELLDQDIGDLKKFADTLLDVISPDGIVLLPSSVDPGPLLAAFDARETKVVQVAGTRRGGYAHIFIDNKAAGREATDHLIMLGHRRIAMIRGPKRQAAAMLRVDGYREALEAASIELDPDLVVDGNFDFESGRMAGIKLLSLPDAPTAIFAANDDMALGVMAAARSIGREVPGDVSVVGFDESVVGLGAWPPLTTVRQPLIEIGRAAVEALMAEKPRSLMIDHQLVIKGSTASPRRGRRR